MSTGHSPPIDDSGPGRFRRLWESSATPPDLFAFLDAAPDLTTDDRAEVVRIDQWNRMRFGRPLSLKVYLQTLPDVASRADLVRVLIQGDRRDRGFPRDDDRTAANPDDTLFETSVEQGDRPRFAPGDDATLPAWRRRDPPTVLDPSEPPRQETALPGSTQELGRVGGAGPSDSFRLDDCHERAADVESLQQMFDPRRFTVVRRIGVGGMGVVFEVFDHDRGEIVALKTMREVAPQALARFKQEFRSLADIAHVNLVSLLHMFAIQDRWFFTMELIEGTDFLTYIRGVPPLENHAGEVEGPSRRPFHEDRLRAGLVQLVTGVHYLHGLGKLHRDLKPTNVLVAGDGRVVVLDFGLTADLASLGRETSANRQIVGTAAHMSPEQAAGREASPASDWYSVGVMIFQALTGRLPFEGSVQAVMLDKQNHAAPTPESVETELLPADLAALCRDLLDRRPEARPTGPMILDRLQGRTPSPVDSPGAGRPVRITGRERHLRVLNSAYEGMKTGRIETVFLHGKAGMGKTTILRAFLDDLEARGEAVVLTGRCHERESFPFKAIDSLIDGLARHLKTLSTRNLQPLLPPDVIHVARTFPVLREIQGVVAPFEDPAEPADPQEGRLRVFTGLRELLSRLAARSPLVLAIDDLHSGDADSAVLLADLLYSPTPPALLFVATYRQEEVGRSRFLQILHQVRSRVGSSVSRHDLAVEPLETTEARDLALALLQRADASAQAQAYLIARESAGNPLFIDELVGHVEAGGLAENSAPPERLDLVDVLGARIGLLSKESARMLELIAVAGRPINEALVLRAGGFAPSTRLALVALRSAGLVRCKCLTKCEAFEVHHDRIREAVLKRLPPGSLAARHAELARAYEAEPGADPEVLAGHLQGAGESARARACHEAAAVMAASVFAFDHAARLYRKALEDQTAEPAERRRLQMRLGDALAGAGRGPEAATTYLVAAETAPTAESLDLKRLAASQLLLSGRIDEGTKLLRTILAPLGLAMPNGARRALFNLAWQRIRLHLRGLGYQPRAEHEIAAEALARIDVCWSVAVGLGITDPIQSACFQTRGLLLALQAGEPYRIARALAMKAANEARVGRSASPEVERLIAMAESLADRIESPHARGIVAMARGSSALLMGDWKRAGETFKQAESLFRNRCVGAAWELDTVHVLALWAVLNMGEVAAATERYHELQREARDRGDLHAASILAGMFHSFIRLAADAPGEDEPLGGPPSPPSQIRPSQGSSVEFLSELRASVEHDLYVERFDRAWAAIDAAWSGFSRSSLSRIQLVRIQVNELRARTALGLSERSAAPAGCLRIVERHARRIEREAAPWAGGHVHHLRAGLAASRKDAASALHELGEAARDFENAGMMLHSCVMRFRMAEIRGGEQGRIQAETLIERIRTFGVASPESWARMMAPGFSRIVSGESDTSF